MAYEPSEQEVAAEAKARDLSTTMIPTNIVLYGCKPNLVTEMHVDDALYNTHGERAVLLSYEVDERIYKEHFHNRRTGDDGSSSITLVKVWYYIRGLPAI